MSFPSMLMALLLVHLFFISYIGLVLSQYGVVPFLSVPFPILYAIVLEDKSVLKSKSANPRERWVPFQKKKSVLDYVNEGIDPTTHQVTTIF